jgi:uncharacterized membrane protein YfcA
MNKMEVSTLVILIIIGLFAGIMSGFVGIGGGIVIVPALVYILGFTQFQAQGMSITLMLPPLGIMAFMNYYNQGHITKTSIIYTSIMAAFFLIGGYFGSKWALKLPENLVKLIFGLILMYVSIRMIINGWAFFSEEK